MVICLEKTKTVVKIGGKEYTICGTESAEYIHRVALRVNGKLEDIKRGNPSLNNVQLSMLTCINLADEYLKLSDEYETLKKENERLAALNAPGTAKFPQNKTK